MSDQFAPKLSRSVSGDPSSSFQATSHGDVSKHPWGRLWRSVGDRLLGLVSRASEDILAARLEIASRMGYRPMVLPYPSYGSAKEVRVLARVLLASTRARPQGNMRGWRTFTSLPVANAIVQVSLNGHTFDVEADDGGVIDQTLSVSLTPGWHQFTMRPVSAGAQGATLGPLARAHVYIVSPEDTVGIVSDVDDTIMVTALPRPLLAAWNTFVLNEHARTPTPGMAVLLERLHTQYKRAPVVYLSTGAWNVAPTLLRFLSRNLYPRGPLLLTDWGPTKERWFRSGSEHKRSNLRRLAHDFPGLKWILVGDDGQRDEAIYAQFAQEHPEAVAAICIRELSPSEAVLAGGRSRHGYSQSTPGIPWAYAPDGAGLCTQLEDLKILRRQA